MEKMIQANKDPDILIKETDQEFVHVKLTKKTVIPGRETEPRVDYEVKCYKPDVFKKMEDLRYAAQPIIWYRAGGFVEAVVVHDPKLWAKQKAEAEQKETEEKERIAVDSKEKEEADKKTTEAKKIVKSEIRKTGKRIAAKVARKGQGTA